MVPPVTVVQLYGIRYHINSGLLQQYPVLKAGQGATIALSVLLLKSSFNEKLFLIKPF